MWRVAPLHASLRQEKKEQYAHLSRKTSRMLFFRAKEARPLGTLWFFQNFQTHYGSFHVSCLKTFEHLSAPYYASFRQDLLLLSDKLWY